MKHSLEAVHNAATDTAAFMTSELRRSANEHGWHPDVVSNMHVQYDNEEFKVHVHPDYQDRAFVHEHGTAGQPPTSVIHKYSHNSENAKQIFHMYLSKYLGMKL